MNMQALMRQAQQMQKDIMKSKEEIDNMEFEGKSNVVKVKVNGKKEILSIKIENAEDISKDLPMLEDMLIVAINEAFKQVDKTTEEKMGKYSNALPGMF